MRKSAAGRMTATRCRAFLNHCSDNVIQEAVDKLILSLGFTLNEVFRDSVAGSVKDRRRLERAVAFAVEEKDPDILVFTVHEGCKAGTTLADLQIALEYFQQTYPDKIVRAFWILLDDSAEEIFCEDASMVQPRAASAAR